MQYLREKVGLFGYAQLDPLVIYKKEAYGKYQTLMATMRKETLAQIMRTDFSSLGNAQPVIQAQPKKINMSDVLKAVTAWLKAQKTPAQASTPKETSVSDLSDDDVEVIEVADDGISGWADLSAVKSKLRPNDKVSVRYTDGRVENNVKWKKVKADVDAGSAEIV